MDCCRKSTIWKVNPVSFPSSRFGSKSTILLVIVVALVLSASAAYFFLEYQTSPSVPLSNFQVAKIEIVSQNSTTTGLVYVASTPSEQSAGFMNVTSFGNCNGKSVGPSSECIGMIFITNSTQNLCFWMHDTRLPLKQVWISSTGTVVEIYNAQPESDISVCHTAMDVLETSPNVQVAINDKILVQSD
ncbi:MAG: DUF192 domain-containing protein [Nitrososphaerales archaeon]